MPNRSVRSVILIALGHLVIELCSSALPVIYPVLMTTMHLSYSQIGVLALVASVSTSLAQPLFGYMSDLWQPRRLSTFSVAWIGLTMGLIGLVPNYHLLVPLVGLAALGSAAFHPPGAVIAAHSAGTRKGIAISTFSVGGNIGAAISPLLITAGMNWLGASGTLLLIPIALGLSAVLLAELAPIVRPAVKQTETHQSAPMHRNYLGLALIVLAVMCLAWFHISMKTYLPIWIKDQSASLTRSGQVMFTFLLATSIGSLLGGSISDRIGHWQLLLGCLILLIPLALLFVDATGLMQWAIVSSIGLLVGAMFPVSIVIAQETWPGNVGLASAMVMGIGWVPGGIGASVTGQIADALSLQAGLRLLAVPLVLGAASILAYALTQKKRRKNQVPS
ncbi:MAG: MFS transporter [Anaerolineae bacterium]|nr:MFS transporter [Anaerolineae bacterium]